MFGISCDLSGRVRCIRNVASWIRLTQLDRLAPNGLVHFLGFQTPDGIPDDLVGISVFA